MAKKRKTAVHAQEPDTVSELDPKHSRKRIRTYEDVADSDDEFHLNRDEVRLGEGPEVKRRRRIAEEEEFLQPSDEEVLDYSSDGGDDSEEGPRDPVSESDDERDATGRAGEEEESGWGMSKADLYGADAIETEEQALEEEAEAIRLQKKQLEQMKAADYGFDDEGWQHKSTATAPEDAANQAVVTEVLPQLQIAPDLSAGERIKLLKSRYPEFEPLSKDLLAIQYLRPELQEKAKVSSVARTKLRAASAYLGALVMYFSLLTSPAAEGAQDVTAISASRIRDHPVMESLISCRDLWTNVATLPEEDLEQMSETSDDEASEISADEKETDSVSQAAIKQPKTRESRAERHAQASRAAAEQRTAERIRRAEASSAGLDALVTLSAKPKSHNASRTRRASIEDSDFGDEAPLTAKEAAEKAQKKKSLRFYTSQITQKANKRGTAGRNAGGDDDIPHRERLKDRQARLNAEAEKRGQRTGAGDGAGADLGDDSDEDDRRQARELRADADEDDYYDLVAARTAKKKESKAALAEAQRQAALHGGQVVPEEVVGTDGKRKISYLIEKNKGLTPHRKKDVRNPRVKKRKKYDEKKKKLASIKPVYKGGEGRGGYGGELTGIKKGLVKSQKLS